MSDWSESKVESNVSITVDSPGDQRTPTEANIRSRRNNEQDLSQLATPGPSRTSVKTSDVGSSHPSGKQCLPSIS